MNLPTLKFDDSFFKEETRWDYTISSDMKKVWAVELDMLQKLLNVCEKYNLKIYADGGTLLGVIRHKGYIPWDDDIDMIMMREDYDKLLEVAPKEFTEPYFFQCHKFEKEWYRNFSKLRNSTTYVFDTVKEKRQDIKYNQGIFIDIFPYDKIPESKLKYLLTVLLIRLRRHAIANFTGWYPRKLKGKVFCSVLKFFHFDAEKTHSKIENLITKQKNTKSPLIAPLSFISEKKFIKDISWYSETELMDFENIKLPVPRGYDEILTKQYGDYMTPVRGAALHNGLFFDTEKSYLEYRNQNSNS